MSVNKKLAIINHLSLSQSIRATVELFYPNIRDSSYNSKRTTILRWTRSRKSLEAVAAQGKGEHSKVRQIGVGTILSTEIEAEIAQWVDDLRGDGIPVLTLMLTDKTRGIANEAGVEGFMASDG